MQDNNIRSRLKGQLSEATRELADHLRGIAACKVFPLLFRCALPFLPFLRRGLGRNGS